MTAISVFGLGYVGSVAAAALAGAGRRVIGVDPNPVKRDLISAGRSPVIEEGLSELIAEVVGSGALTVTDDVDRAVSETDISVVCVGTPSRGNGSLDLSYVERVAADIGTAMASSGRRHTVIIRSTMLPGSTEEVVIPALEKASGLRAGADFGVVYNPEFLREGSSLRDFFAPPFTVLGSDDDAALDVASGMYSMLDDDPIRVGFRVAEMVKYTSNAYHALKVAFANEVGSICATDGMDGRTVMDIVCRDTKLNISPAYLRPGFAFGGSCLPKDMRALLHHARDGDVDVPVLDAILPSNRLHIERALRQILESGAKRVGVLGFSFKAGTDDLRESPVVELIERLIGKGYDVRLFDENVSLANLHGSNREYIENDIPHISQLMMSTTDEVVRHAEVIVIGNGDPAFAPALERATASQVVLDLIGVVEDPSTLAARYCGLVW